MTDADLIDAGVRAVAEATRLWKSDVYDPSHADKTQAGVKSKMAINAICHAGGWTWIDYRGDGDVEWCGLFVAACWRVAGIDPRWLATYFASTYRLDTWAHYRPFGDDGKHPNPRPAAGPWRLICNLDSSSKAMPFTPHAGDILMIGDGTPPYGDHICLVESYDNERRVFHTLEGNGRGLGPDGKWRQGVVRGTRYLGGLGYCARRLVRPAPSDLLPPIPVLH